MTAVRLATFLLLPCDFCSSDFFFARASSSSATPVGERPFMDSEIEKDTHLFFMANKRWLVGTLKAKSKGTDSTHLASMSSVYDI